MRTALTIAGSDSGGGAGIQADLKTFAALGLHGASVITALTAQNTREVSGVHNVPPDFILAQFDAVHRDFEVAAAKTGMLSNTETISAVARGLGDYPLVIDPVMVAESGARLLDEEAVEALMELFTKAVVITPNLAETQVLTGMKIKTIEDMKEAARDLANHGCSVLIKGGHLNATDVLYHHGEFHVYEGRLLGGGAHGSGCTMASATCAGLAKGDSLPDAVGLAKEFITLAIKNAYSPGHGAAVVNPLGGTLEASEKFKILEGLGKIVEELEASDYAPLVPEVGTNITWALPWAKGPEDVAGITGRIVKVGSSAKAIGRVDFGASKHVASIVLAAMSHDPTTRSCMNIRFSEHVVDICKDLGFSVSSFSRKEEPQKVSTMEWGTHHAIKTLGHVPDIIYDKGGIGKEAMIRVLGSDPDSVWEKVQRILTLL